MAYQSEHPAAFDSLTSAGQAHEALPIYEYATHNRGRNHRLCMTAQLHFTGPGSKAHCLSFAYGALQNGYGRALQSRPHRQHGRQRTDNDDRQPAYEEELPWKDYGQAVDKGPIDHGRAQSN